MVCGCYEGYQNVSTHLYKYYFLCKCNDAEYDKIVLITLLKLRRQHYCLSLYVTIIYIGHDNEYQMANKPKPYINEFVSVFKEGECEGYRLEGGEGGFCGLCADHVPAPHLNRHLHLVVYSHVSTKIQIWQTQITAIMHYITPYC